MHPGSSNPSEIEWDPIQPERERRGRPRRRPSISSYAVGDTVVSGRVAELNEIVDISEEGMGIQALWPLTVGHTADFRLDLPKPSTYAEVKGTVIWSEPSGRAGVRFAEISKNSQRELRAWLSANTATTEGNLPSDPTAQPPEEQEDADRLLCEIVAANETPESRNADYTSVLAALAAVKREVESLSSDRDAALQLIARRAQVFTQASGVAIALSAESEMTCRAAAGADTPPIGARLQIGSGFSGECVRTGSLLHCKDAETNPLVDHQSCRALGIRSMVAVPIRSAEEVIGLLEVFSPEANHFGADDEIVLQRLALIVSEMVRAPAPRQGAAAETPANSVDDEFPIETPADLPLPQFSPSRNGLLISAGVTVVIAIFWLIGTWDGNHPATARLMPLQLQSEARSEAISPSTAQTAAGDLEGLRRLAEQGDSTAQFALGTRYAIGQDVPQDYAEATRWFTQAAEQGNVIAQSALAAYYWSGRGVTQDPVKAYFWSLVAQASGDETSKSRIAALESQLDRNDIALAQQQADAWLKQHPAARKDAAPAQ